MVVLAILDKHEDFPGISHDSLLDRVAPKWDRGDSRWSVKGTLIGVIECLCDMAELPTDQDGTIAGTCLVSMM
jgi:hypothetical protein